MRSLARTIFPRRVYHALRVLKSGMPPVVGPAMIAAPAVEESPAVAPVTIAAPIAYDSFTWADWTHCVPTHGVYHSGDCFLPEARR